MMSIVVNRVAIERFAAFVGEEEEEEDQFFLY
jgi:hypothetical protein